MSYLVFLIAIFLSGIAAYYSVMGMVAIFSAAALPVVLMASGLEAAKLITASWLYNNWNIAPRFLKYYLSIAVVILMFITSMGIFGFLSKAHLDQAVPTGDVVARVVVLDDKIKTARENIDTNRKAIKQYDEAVDQSMSRSTDEKGADKAVAIRRSQAKDRLRLQQEITTEQRIIGQLTEERAPWAAQVRKIEAEVGPLKYIAKLIYSENPSPDILEKAVTWVIMVLIFVFDPLAVLLLIAANVSRTHRPHALSTVLQGPSRWSRITDKLRNIQSTWSVNRPPTNATTPAEFTQSQEVVQLTSIRPKARTKPSSASVTNTYKKTETPKKRKLAKVIPVTAVRTQSNKSTTPLNTTKKIIADDAATSSNKIKVRSVSSDLEDLYKDIVTELTPKKPKPNKGGWFPETKK